VGKFSDEFDKTLATITQDRGKTYGHPFSTFDQIARYQIMVIKCPDPRIRHALEMICVKLVRLCQDPSSGNLDSAVDIAGYARTIAMIWDEADEENE